MKFPGTIIGIDKKDGEENQREDVLMELTDATRNGMVEIRFIDRNEEFYVKFCLQDLVREAMALGRDAE